LDEKSPEKINWFQLGWNYERVRQCEKAVEMYLQHAKEEPKSFVFFKLGHCYEHFLNDCPKAIVWYTKAALQDHMYAQFRLALCFDFGRGTEKNPKKAFEWYTKAALQGHCVAEHHLGICYFDGEGVTKDPSLAFTWMQKSCDHDYIPASRLLGTFYEDGIGVAKDEKKAFDLYTSAAQRNDKNAQYVLGKRFQTGKCTAKQDFKQCFDWYEKAANNNHSHSKYELAFCYDHGRGVAKNHEKAHEWYTRYFQQDKVLIDFDDLYFWMNDTNRTNDPLTVVNFLTELISFHRNHPENKSRLEQVLKDYDTRHKSRILKFTIKEKEQYELNQTNKELKSVLIPEIASLVMLFTFDEEKHTKEVLDLFLPENILQIASTIVFSYVFDT
jgi:TPR repeat protein